MSRAICCPWTVRILGILGIAGIGIGCFCLGKFAGPSVAWELPPIALNATATDAGQEFAIATGPVSDEAEGLFVLDFATGQLSCDVLYTRTKIFGARFVTNVKEVLPGDVAKGVSKFLMVTGRADFSGGGSAQRGAGVVYILDTVSGTYVAYGVPFDKTMVAGGRPQQGFLVPMGKGMARGVPDRSR